MITKRKTPDDGRNHRAGVLKKGTERAPLRTKNITTPQKIKGFMIDCLLAVASVPAVLLLAPLAILAVARLFGRAT